MSRFRAFRQVHTESNSPVPLLHTYHYYNPETDHYAMVHLSSFDPSFKRLNSVRNFGSTLNPYHAIQALAATQNHVFDAFGESPSTRLRVPGATSNDGRRFLESVADKGIIGWSEAANAKNLVTDRGVIKRPSADQMREQFKDDLIFNSSGITELPPNTYSRGKEFLAKQLHSARILRSTQFGEDRDV